MKKIILVLLAMGAIGGGIGFYLFNKPVSSLQNKKPDIEVSASKLIIDYEANEESADNLYLGKLLQVSGKVAEITSEAGKHKIHLASGNPMSLIICEIEEGKDFGTLKPGDDAKIKGMCSGYLSDVILVQATVVK
jgi:predicted extracellular nuclease